MIEQLQCPNCGAPINGDTCDYCGTQFFDFACMDTEKPFYLKIRHKGEIMMFRVCLTETEIESHYYNSWVSATTGGLPTYMYANPDIDISMMFKVISDEAKKYRVKEVSE